MSKTTSKTSSSALQVLKDDHREVEDLFSQFEKLGPRATKSREAIVERVIELLSAHASVEEMVFYPAIRRHITDSESAVLEALEEHHIVKWTMSELENMSATDERFIAKMTVLIEMVRHHVREEEHDMFPVVRDGMSRSDLEALGEALLQAKQSAPSRPHPRSPDTPPGNFVVGAITAPIDAVRSVGETALRKARDLVQR